ncbi:MAG: M15 family metallopeptidase [Thermoleophilia bacterium]
MRLLALVLLAASSAQAPPFAARVSQVTRAELGASWHAGCPIAPAALRRVRLTYRGFDGEAHAGALIVNADAVPDVKRIFARLYAGRFPIRRMRTIDAFGGSDDRSMAADNTSAFNCRYAVAPGPPHWSAHAYGRAIDINPVENPYLEAGRVLPPAGRAFLDRKRARHGMAVAGGLLVRSFEAAGWQWGGRWKGSPDYQHFQAR